MESQKSAGITSKISPPSITKDDKYYFRDGSIVILVEGRLFKIHQSLFERDSVLFQSSFSLSQDTSPDESGSTSLAGSSDDTPVVSNDRLADFRALCWAVYSRPADMKTQQSIAVKRLISLAAISHKYEFQEFCNWALSLLDEHSKESQGQFISSCSGWDDVRRLFSLAEQCGHKLLTQRIEEEWVHQISDGSPSGAGLDAFKQAVAVAEGSTKLRRFHGRVYYAYLRATGIFDAPSSADVAAYNLGYRPNSYGVGKYLSRLSDKQKVHMYQGLWSLSQFRNELVRAPGIPEELSCESHHADKCVVAWQMRWKTILDEARQAGRRLNDPRELLEEVQKDIEARPICSQVGRYKSPGPPIKCNPTIQLLLSFTKGKLDDAIADHFMIY